MGNAKLTTQPTNQPTNQPTLCKAVLLHKPAIFGLSNKWQEFYGTESFITVFTTARHLPLPEPD
jgi:hypothetical protein